MKRLYSLYLSLGLSLILLLSSHASAQGLHQHVAGHQHWCGTPDPSPQELSRSLRAIEGSQVIHNDKYLRVFRLALAIDYPSFKDDFNLNLERAKEWRRKAVDTLNTIFTRDLGVKFELVEDDRLIRQTEAQWMHYDRRVYAMNRTKRRMSPSAISQEGTTRMNQTDNDLTMHWDIGIWVCRVDAASESAGVRGLSSIGQIYNPLQRANCMVAVPSVITMAHELGHLFGGYHTHTSRDLQGNTTSGEQTEVADGESIMSYGPARREFSLPSIRRIRELLHTQRGYTNPDTGITYPELKETLGSAPQIDKSRLKPSYRLPVQPKISTPFTTKDYTGTSFTFPITSSDADGDDLFYGAHVSLAPDAAIRSNRSDATYIASVFRKDSPVPYQRLYDETNGGLLINGNNEKFPLGVYKFILAVRDSRAGDPDFKTNYDSYETSVEFAQGTPFILKKQIAKSYRGGDKINLEWDVDRNFFPVGSKVRILLSDNLGYSFDHVLVAETDNDGTETITLPTSLNIGRTNNPAWGDNNVGQGVIKIEVIDHIAYALSAYQPGYGNAHPLKGGFTLEATEEPINPQDEGIGSIDKANNNPNGGSASTYPKDAPKYEITKTVLGKGEIEITYVGERVVRVVARPDAGYKLTGLTANGEDILSTRSFTPNSATEVIARFEPENSLAQRPFKVYPNPATEYINVQAPSPQTAVYLVSLAGDKLLLGYTDEVGSGYFHIGGMPSALYYVWIGNNKSQALQIR